jgi:ubiquinone biosynthesis monooxygenase Coq7
LIDGLIVEFDRALRAVFAPARSARPVPGEGSTEDGLSSEERAEVAALMRVNHSGEICAQALYRGQASASREESIRMALHKAAAEEGDHLSWTEHRLAELGGRTSLLNPLWYAGAFAIGWMAGRIGDDWSLGFLAETERQVEAHLDRHMQRLPADDRKSRAIIDQMRADESGHAQMAERLGARKLPGTVRYAMKLASGVMTRTAYWI